MHIEDQKIPARIAALNDAFRKSFDPKLGKVMLTAGVNSLPSGIRAMAIRKTATFDAFTSENDPHGEHDFGSFDLAGEKFFFKIDYYAPDMEHGSEDPSDPSTTVRVPTIMLAEEY